MSLWFVTSNLWFAAAMIFVALWLVEREKLSSYKRVGQWYEQRVAELENETRQLAQQVINATGHPGIAMPIPPPIQDYEYATDPTGIVVERLDPRDVPFAG